MTYARISLVEVAFVVVFSLAFSTSSLKTFSILQGQDFPLKLYLVAGIASVATFSIFLFMLAAVRAWVGSAVRRPD